VSVQIDAEMLLEAACDQYSDGWSSRGYRHVLAPEFHFSAIVANSALDKNRSTECLIQRLPADACQASVYQFILSRIINRQEGNTYKLDLFMHTRLIALLNRCHRHMLIQWLLYCTVLYCTVRVASRKKATWLWLTGR